MYRDNAKESFQERVALQFQTEHVLLASFNFWKAHVYQTVSRAKNHHIAICHWSHMAVANAFASWIKFVHYTVWKRGALSRALGFMGNKPLGIAFFTWQANVQKLRRDRNIIMIARHRAMHK